MHESVRQNELREKQQLKRLSLIIWRRTHTHPKKKKKNGRAEFHLRELRPQVYERLDGVNHGLLP